MNKVPLDRRSWWRKHFDDHPGAATKTPDAYVQSDTGHTKTRKVYCNACLIVDIQQTAGEDVRAISQGRLTAVRTNDEIEAYCELINWSMYTI